MSCSKRSSCALRSGLLSSGSCNSTRRQTIDQGRALSVVLGGRSPVTGADERVTVFTRDLPDGHVLYALFVAPAQDYSALSQTFQAMVSSLRVNDRAAHSEPAS